MSPGGSVGVGFWQVEEDPNDPFAEKSEGSARMGADFKVGLGKGLVLNGTVNPDFAQVEADPAQLNLTAFETIYPERRPFFTEAQQYLEGPIGNLFYSRRVGARRTAIPVLRMQRDQDGNPG